MYWNLRQYKKFQFEFLVISKLSRRNSSLFLIRKFKFIKVSYIYTCNKIPKICTSGCLEYWSGKCVKYTGPYLPNLNINSGINFDEALKKVDALITSGGGGPIPTLQQVVTVGNTSNLSIIGVTENSSDNSNRLASTAWVNQRIAAIVPPPQVNSDWNAVSGVAQILNKPNLNLYYLASNPNGYISSITSGMIITALGYTPYDGTINPNGYLSSITSLLVTNALGYTPVPNTRTITINGTTLDLSANRSWTITQVNSDWNSVSGVSQILNKPILSTVATTGDYDDLINKPVIPVTYYRIDILTNQSDSDLNTLYPSAIVGTRVIAKNIPTGGIVYEKDDDTLDTWIRIPILNP